MALSHITSKLRSPTKDPVILSGRFEFNGASAPTAAQTTAVWIDSITRNGAGDLTVTVKPQFRPQAVIANQATLELASAGDSIITVGPYSAGTFSVFVHTAGAPADLATTNFCSLALHCKYSVAPDGSGV